MYVVAVIVIVFVSFHRPVSWPPTLLRPPLPLYRERAHKEPCFTHCLIYSRYETKNNTMLQHILDWQASSSERDNYWKHYRVHCALHARLIFIQNVSRWSIRIKWLMESAAQYNIFQCIQSEDCVVSKAWCTLSSGAASVWQVWHAMQSVGVV